MTATEFRDWLNAHLAELVPTADQPASEYEAGIVAEAKQYCFELGLLDFALTLPQEPQKTPLACAIQLKRCLRELAAPTDASNTEHLSIRQAAQAFNISERTLYRLCNNNDLQHSRIGSALDL